MDSYGNSDARHNDGPIRIHVDLHYHHRLPRGLAPYLTALAQGQLLGRRCPGCERVYCPPRASCLQCGHGSGESWDWISLPNEGEVVSFTTATAQIPFTERSEPAHWALIAVPGAHNHLLGRIRAEQPLTIGTRLVLERDPQAHVHPAQASQWRVQA